MNRMSIVRFEADTIGVQLRVWIDDENGQHVCVAEGAVEEETLIAWARAIAHEQNRAAQYMLRFDT